MAFTLLALAVPDPVKTEIQIAYPGRNIVECILLAIVFSVNAGKVINTRRELVKVVSLMLFKSLILCVHLEASWNRPFPNYLWPLFQSESWCSSFHMKISFHLHVNQN